MITTKDRLRVPEALLISKELLPSAKLVWIALMLGSDEKPQIRHSKSRLAAITGLSRPTVYKSLAALQSSGWYSMDKPYSIKLHGPSITINIDTFLDTSLGIWTRLLHGLLQLKSGFKSKIEQCRYSSLSKELNVGVKTVRNAVGQLVRSGWLVMKQNNQLAAITLTFRNPIKEQFDVMQARAEINLKDAEHKGEALMKEFLSLLVTSDNYIDNAKPGFLRNVKTDKLMEFDRYYPNIAAFEFNGSQHYQPTELYSLEKVEKQKARDKQKKQISDDKRIELIIIHPEDLTINGMLSKIGRLLPLRDLRGGGRLIGYLERFSANYRRKVPRLIEQIQKCNE